MTLGTIYVFCDDMQIYKIGSEIIEGDGWMIFLEDYKDDQLLIATRPGQPGPDELIASLGLPITRVRRNGDHKIGKQYYAKYWFAWADGVPFPRTLLPANLQPRPREKAIGEIKCYLGKKKREEFLARARA